MAFWATCKIAQPIQPIWQHIFALPWSALKKPPWKFNFFHIFGIPSSSRHEKSCQILQTFFGVFQYSRNSQWIGMNLNELEWLLFHFYVNFQMEPHSTFWGSWPSASPYWAILEKVHERKNLPRQRRKSISSCIWSRGHNNLIKILRTINDMRVCIVCFWLRAFTIEVQEMTT